MLDTQELNVLGVKAVGTAIQLYQDVNSWKNGNSVGLPTNPLQVVTAVRIMVADLQALTKELEKHAQDGKFKIEHVVQKYSAVSNHCRHFDALTSIQTTEESLLVRELDGIMVEIEDFLEDVSKKCKELQQLRERTAATWQGVTAGGGVVVAGGAAALCVLSGPALPVMAPLVAAGLAFTGVAAASHIAFSPTIGKQIANMDEQLLKLNALKRDMASQQHKAASAQGLVTGGTPLAALPSSSTTSTSTPHHN